MDKTQIQARMREILTEYNGLKDQLNEIISAQERGKWEQKQRDAFDKFKATYTLEANMTNEFKTIPWDEVEKMLFHEDNIKSMGVDGWSLGYDETGMPGLGGSYRGGGTFTPYAVDEVDAKRYVEREERRREWQRKYKK